MPIPDILWTELDFYWSVFVQYEVLDIEKNINMTEFQRVLKQEIVKYVKSKLGFFIFACLKTLLQTSKNFPTVFYPQKMFRYNMLEKIAIYSW